MEDKGLLTALETIVVYPIQLVFELIAAILQYPGKVLEALFSSTP
jgi:hypothetical protein